MRVLIVDDEAMARRRVRRLLTEEADVTIVAECANGAHVRAMLANQEAAQAGRQLQKLLMKALQDTPPSAAVIDEGTRYPARLKIKSGDGVALLPVEDVDCIEADGNLLRVHAGGQTHVMRETMQAIEATLDPSRFARVHRSM